MISRRAPPICRSSGPFPILLVLPALALASWGCASAPRACPPCGSPAATAAASTPRSGPFWTLRSAGASDARLAEVRAALTRCSQGLAPHFPGRIAPLSVLAYGERAAFVRGLRRELRFGAREAAYFRRNGAPRPLQGKMLVPPEQKAVNICHELVHHHLESAVPRARLMQAKWFDEGVATYLADVVFDPARVRQRLGYFNSRARYLPFHLTRDEAGWNELHRDITRRGLAYFQAMSMVNQLFKHLPEGGFQQILRLSAAGTVDGALQQVTGAPPERLFEAWVDATRADWSVRLHDKGAPAGPDPAAVGLDPAALARLVQRAAETRSDTLLVLKDGKAVVERHFTNERGPIETMSVTKSIAALAVAALLAEGRIPGLDTPMHRWFPDFAKDARAAVTLRHVLTHTSGLGHQRTTRAMSAHKDRTAYAATRPAAEPPGRRFSYNNTATQLLGRVVALAAGVPLDRYLEQKVLAPLGITSWRWERDPSGGVLVYAGLALSARDLGRVGQLLLERGRAGETQVLPGEQVVRLTTPGLPAFPHMGLLWWLRHRGAAFVQTATRLERLTARGLPGARLLRRFSGKTFASEVAYWLEVGAALPKPGRAALAHWCAVPGHDAPIARTPGEQIGFSANGWQGQYLAVYPGANLVVVRQRRPVTFTEQEHKKYGFHDFFERVEALLPAKQRRPSRCAEPCNPLISLSNLRRLTSPRALLRASG